MKEYCFDVVVAGGGPAGISAAIASARRGKKTMLIEVNGCVGGTCTAGALPFWLGHTNGSIPFPQMVKKGLQYKDLPHPRKAVGGIFEEAMNRIKDAEGGVGPCKLAQTDKYPGLDRLGCHDEFTFDIEIGKRVLEEMLVEAGVTIRYYARVIDAVREGNVIKGIKFADKGGVQYVTADAFIDCTGDADVVDYAGFATYKGDKVTGEMTSTSLVCHIENIDTAAVETYLNEGGDPWFCAQYKQAVADYPDAELAQNPKDPSLIIFPMFQEGVFMVNSGSSFSNYDGTNGEHMTELTLRGRQRAKNLVEILFRKYMPGGENARLRLTAAYPGVRETRRIISEGALTEQHLLEGTSFEDTVALAGRHFDLYRSTGQEFADKEKKVKKGITEIPYSCMIPKGSENIIVAGRCVEAEGQALGPARIISTCFAMGEAAGTAAAHKLDEAKSFKCIDVQALRADLRNHGAEIDV